MHEQVPRAGDLLESVERLAKVKDAARVRGEVVNTLGQPDEDGLVEVEPCLRRGKLTPNWWTLYPRIAAFARRRRIEENVAVSTNMFLKDFLGWLFSGQRGAPCSGW